VRRILEIVNVSVKDKAPWDDSKSVGSSLLTPTKIYVRPLLQIIKKRLVKGLAHITGGGLIENVPRMLPSHLAGEIDVASWTLPPVFKWLKQAGNVPALEIGRTFNCGIGIVAVVGGADLEQVLGDLHAVGEKACRIGQQVPRKGEACVLKDVDSWD